MATATKKNAAKKAAPKASAAEVDDLLGGKKAAPAKKAKAAKADDVLEPKAAKKAKAGGKAKAKKAPERTGVSSEQVKEFLLKCRKLTSYADVAEATGADLRMVRRTSRAMRDDGEIEIVKEGTVCFVKKA